MKVFFEKDQTLIYLVITWLVSFLIYLQTLAPTVGFIDSGELATVTSTLGIAHPTGYPLFTLLGRIFFLLPIATEEIVRLNIMSALCTSLSVAFFFLLMLELLKGKNTIHKDHNIAASLFASLTLAFSQTFWKQGVIVEVYSLHLLLILLTIFFFIKAINTEHASYWLFFAFVYGLTFTNHLTAILLAPACLYLFFAEHKFTRAALQKIGRLSMPFFLGLSVYLYLPIRAASQPILNWGNPQTLEKFWWHVTGKQFRVWMFASGEAAQKQFNYFLERIPLEFVYIPVILSYSQ